MMIIQVCLTLEYLSICIDQRSTDAPVATGNALYMIIPHTQGCGDILT